jgi:hypothetical protein
MAYEHRQGAIDCDILTVPALARRSGIDVRRLRAAIRRGELPAYTGGTAWPRVVWSDFLAWLRSTPVAQPGDRGPRAA